MILLIKITPISPDYLSRLEVPSYKSESLIPTGPSQETSSSKKPGPKPLLGFSEVPVTKTKASSGKKEKTAQGSLGLFKRGHTPGHQE
tara:strand:+ start:1123 stop:1386 length:264 start_codon:yes stop_codon:yes gene_type:complete